MVKNVWMLMLGLILASGLRAIQAEVRQLQVYPHNIHSDIVLNIDRSYQDFSFSINPTPLLRTYYDYMIGSYNGNPLQLVPTNNGSLYLMTYHGSRQPTSNRRVFCSRIETDSQIYTGEMTELTNAEGFPGLSIDPVLGTPHYAMQVNYDGDPYQEVMYVSEEMLFGSYEDFFFNQLLVNNPITITSGSTTTTDNTFLWPIVTTGPSPIAGKRRVYVLCSNASGHGSSSRGNPLIAMADFDYEDVEFAIPLVWNYVTLPELNDWNIDPITQRQMYLTILTDTAGSVYLCGYHDTTIGDVQTPEIDIIKSTNYGTGTWTRNSFPTNVSSWNPPCCIGKQRWLLHG